METFGTGQIVGIVLIATAIIDTYVLPKILLKKFDDISTPTMTPQQKAELEGKRKIIKIIIAVTTSIPAILGLLFFLGIIPV
jgi:hypothetical protein